MSTFMPTKQTLKEKKVAKMLFNFGSSVLKNIVVIKFYKWDKIGVGIFLSSFNHS